MGRHGSPEKKLRQAKDIVRRLTSLGGMEGVPWLEQGRLWLLGPMLFPPSDPVGLARVLLAEVLPGRVDFLRLVGCRKAVPLEVTLLSTWARALADLEGRRDLETLVAEGVRPLRGYRGIDLRARITAAGATLRKLGMLVQALPAAARCQTAGSDEEVPPEELVQALPARLYALGNWGIDPAQELLARDVRADNLLLDLAATAKDPTLADLAAVLLGGRLRHAASDQGRITDLLPSYLVPAFQAGLAGCSAPCLWALTVAQRSAELPDLRALARAERGRLIQAAERVVLLQGAPVALQVLNLLGRPIDGLAWARDRLRRLASLVENYIQDHSTHPQSAEEKEVVRQLRGVGSHAGTAVRRLVELFLGWMEDGAGDWRVLTRQHLVRLATSAWARGEVAALWSMGDAWLAVLRGRDEVGRTVSREILWEQLALLMAFPGTLPSLPEHADGATLQALRVEIQSLSAKRLHEVWPVLVSDEGLRCLSQSHHPDSFSEVLHGNLPVTLIQRALKHQALYQADRLADSPRSLSLYLDCLDGLSHLEMPHLDRYADWFVGLFRTGRPWVPAAVLALLNKVRESQSPENESAEVFALGQALVGAGPFASDSQVLGAALEEWGCPSVKQPPPELEALQELPGLSRVRLEEYLHYRRLAGHRETFASALLEPLHQTAQETREANYLRDRLAAGGLDPQVKANLAERLFRLMDPERNAERLLATAAGTRNRLERALELLRRDSLECVLDDVCRVYLQKFLGKAVPPGPLPAGLRDAIFLLSAQQIDHALLAGFITDVLQGRPLADRPANRAWLARAEATGLCTSAWLAGVGITVKVGGTHIAFATEHDPLAVLRMGSYFNTCLSLETGFNAASTLINALDVNKQVIYGRRPDGTVVARKLIGATLGCELAGYKTYAAQHGDETRVCLAQILRDFAQRCNLRLSDTATPEVLHQGFWYDDGNETWLHESEMPATLEKPPEGIPSDAAAEWNYRIALETKDLDRLKVVIRQGERPWREAALVQLLVQNHALGELKKSVDFDGLCGWMVEEWLTALGQLTVLRSLPLQVDCREGERSHTHLPYRYLPFDREVIRESLRPIRGHKGICCFCYRQLPRFAAVVPTAELVSATRRVQGSSEDLKRLSLQASRLLEISWLMDQDTVPLMRELTEGHPLLEQAVIELACRRTIPLLAPALRALLKRETCDVEKVALALGTQGAVRDGPRLLALLRQRPESLALAVAVARTEHRTASEEARSLWRPPRNLQGLDCDLARELASPRLVRALRNEIRRELNRPPAPDMGEASDDYLDELFLKLATLGFPGPEGDAVAFLRGFADAKRFSPYHHGFRILLDNVQDKVEQVKQRDLAETENRKTRKECTLPLVQEEFDSLEALALLRPDVSQLSEGQRLHWAERSWESIAEGSSGTPPIAELEAALVWLEGLPPPVQLQVILAAPGVFARLSHETMLDTPLWLLRLESADPQRVRAVQIVLEAWAQASPGVGLLRTLDGALIFVRPEVAELVVSKFLATIDPSSLYDADLIRCITDASLGPSYRFAQALVRELLPRLAAYRHQGLFEAFTEKFPADGRSAREQWLLDQLGGLAAQRAAEQPNR